MTAWCIAGSAVGGLTLPPADRGALRSSRRRRTAVDHGARPRWRVPSVVLVTGIDRLGRSGPWRRRDLRPDGVTLADAQSPHPSPGTRLPLLGLGRHPGGLRPRCRRPARRDGRRADVPRRPQRRAAPDAPAGLPGPQRRAADGHARDARAARASADSRSSSTATSAGSTTTSRSSSTRWSSRSGRASTAGGRRREHRATRAARRSSRTSHRSGISSSTCCPTTWPARCSACSTTTSWTTTPARFEELMDELRDQLLQSYFNQMAEGMQNMSPEQMGRMKDMLAELNQMLEQRERGEEPDFEGFMERYGDFFPGNPAVARRAARADGAVDGCDAATPQLDDARAARAAAAARRVAARGHGLALADGRARPQPSAGVPRHELGSPVRLRPATSPMSMGQMSSVLQTIGDLDSLEQMLQSVTQPGQLAEVDLDQARDLLGDDAARSLERLQRARRRCSRRPGSSTSATAGTSSPPRGCARSARRRSATCSARCSSDRLRPARASSAPASATSATYEHKPYEFGDPFHLNVEQTVRNAIWRQGSGTPVHLVAGGLRGRAHRGDHPLGHRAHARRVDVDADARQLPAGEEGGDGVALAHHHPVPP